MLHVYKTDTIVNKSLSNYCEQDGFRQSPIDLAQILAAIRSYRSVQHIAILPASKSHSPNWFLNSYLCKLTYLGYTISTIYMCLTNTCQVNVAWDVTSQLS